MALWYMAEVVAMATTKKGDKKSEQIDWIFIFIFIFTNIERQSLMIYYSRICKDWQLLNEIHGRYLLNFRSVIFIQFDVFDQYRFLYNFVFFEGQIKDL